MDAVIEKVTLGVSPAIWLDQYKSLKAHATVTLAIPPGGLKDSHLAFGAAHLRRAVFQSLKVAIEVWNDGHAKLMESADTDALYQACIKEIGDVTQHESFTVSVEETHQEAGPQVGGKRPVKKPVPVGKGKPAVL